MMKPNRLMLLSVVLLCAGAGHDALAAKLPDWADAIARSAPEVDPAVTDEEFRILFRERRIAVGEDGTLTVRDRIAKQALSPHADEVGVAGFFLGPGAKIRRSRAWHHLAGKGTKKSGRSDALDISGFDSFLTDRTVRSVAIEGVREGSIVFFEFEGDWKPYVLASQYGFASSSVVDRSRLVVELPPGWKLHADWMHAPGVEPQVNGSTYTFELTGLRFPIEEELSFSVADRAPRVHLGFEPPSDVGVPYLATWTDLGRWFEDLSRQTGTVTEEIESAVEKAASGAGEDPVALALHCARYVRDRVRYVAKAIGIGGYRPRFADATLRELWGDCKDKATLLRAMLATHDVAGYPVLVSLTRDETVSEKVPSLDAFDHMILAVSLPKGQQLPERYAVARLSDDQLGELLIVDVTDENTSVGWISGSLAGKRALLVAGDKSHLITLPGRVPDAHRREREVTIRVGEDGSAKITHTTRNYGAMATWYRSSYAQSQKELRETLESVAHDLWTGARIDDVSLVPEDDDGAFVATLEWTVDALPRGASGAVISPFPRARSALPSTATSRREAPVVYGFPRIVSATVTIEGLPESVALPKNRAKEGDGWRVERSFTRDGSSVRAHWSLRLEKTRYEQEEFRSLKSLYRALREVSGVNLTLL